MAVIGVLEDKDAAAMLRALLPRFEHVVFTRLANPRALSPATLVSLAEKLAPGVPAEAAADPRAAVERARALAGPGGAVLATGSIYLIADLLREDPDARASTLMRVFLAGGSGVVAARLIPALGRAGHAVTALTRSPEKEDTIRALGAEPAVADALDREAIVAAVRAAEPEAVIHQLTAIPDRLNPRKMARDFELTNRLRSEGTDNLIEAARESGPGACSHRASPAGRSPARAGRSRARTSRSTRTRRVTWRRCWTPSATSSRP